LFSTYVVWQEARSRKGHGRKLFIRDGQIAKTIGREQKVLKSFEADPKVTLFNGPVVVLIDTGTAGAAEVVASAFLEGKRGDVVARKASEPEPSRNCLLCAMATELLLTTLSGRRYRQAILVRIEIVPVSRLR